MALDANADTAGIQTTRTVSGTETFRVGLHITQIAEAYNAYFWTLSIPTGLGYSGAIVENVAGTGLAGCDGPAVLVMAGETRVQEGNCRGSFPLDGSIYLGQTTSFALHCAANGTYVLSLLDLADDIFGSTLYAPGAQLLDTGTADISVECTNVTAAPTATPITPTTTPAPDAPNIMSLDASPDSPGIQTTRVVATPHAGYQWQFEFPPAGLTFGGNVGENITSTGLAVCAHPGSGVPPPLVPSNTVIGGGAGCITFDQPVNWVGELTRLQMSCAAPGTYEIVLHDKVTDPFGSGLSTFTCADRPRCRPVGEAAVL